MAIVMGSPSDATQTELHKKMGLTKITDDLVKYEYRVIIAIIEY